MTRAQATALVWFIKFTIRFFEHGTAIKPGEYVDTEERIIALLSDEVI